MLIYVWRVFIRKASGTACFSRTACFSMTGVVLWDYLGENLLFDMDKIVIMREEYFKRK